jgi:hypothetical protein
MPLSRLVGLLKGRCSRLLRTAFPHLRLFLALQGPSWLVSTVGAPLAVVRRHVAHQQGMAGG